jgi:hypothetical protein
MLCGMMRDLSILSVPKATQLQLAKMSMISSGHSAAISQTASISFSSFCKTAAVILLSSVLAGVIWARIGRVMWQDGRPAGTTAVVAQNAN